MKNKEIEELLKGMKDVSNTEGCSMNLDRYLVKLLLSYIEQLQECYCNRTDCIGRIKDSKKYDSLLQKYKQLENKNKENSLLLIEFQDMEQRIEQLENNRDKAIDKIQLLIDIGFDYDGLNKVESLKGLIDELVSYAIESRKILKGDSDE